MFALPVAALLTQLGIPAYANLSADLHRATVARDLAQALRTARSHAVLQSQPVRVQPLENDWGKGWRVLLEHNQQVLREQRLSRPIRIAENTGGQVRFSAVGMPLGLFGATLEICERSATASRYSVIVSSAGRIRLSVDGTEKSLCAEP
jgi:type IV fimbrial biogenesis protein FimT